MPDARASRDVSRPPANARRRRWARWTLTGVGTLVLVALALLLLVLARLGVGPAEALSAARDAQPIEIVRYAEYRLLGHPNLEAVILPALQAVRRRIEREPAATLTDLGKGQQTAGLPSQRYEPAGRPLASTPSAEAPAAPAATRIVGTLDELDEALGSADPGAVVELAPGNYGLERTLVTRRAGQPGMPIAVRARQPGTVVLEVRADQAFVVNQPYWLFENLTLRGTCADDSDCEHAFHVVANAAGTVIRNNRIENFNAHVKINGEGSQWPDGGLLQFNTLANSAPRRTGRPVSPVDLVGASAWQVLDNRVENFVKSSGNAISYGIYMKGGGARGRIERNLVVCTTSGISQPGLRIGVSLGNGGTGAAYCRSPGCSFEHERGVIANNVIAHCNDAGIDVFRSIDALIAHNTLINTRGVLVRDAPAEADVFGNLIEGSVRERRGGRVRATESNLIESSVDNLLVAPDALDLRWREMPSTTPRLPEVSVDFCGRQRPLANPAGATLAAACR